MITWLPTKSLWIIWLLFAILFSTLNAFGQGTCESECNTQTNPYVAQQAIVPIDGLCSASINYRHRQCNGVNEMIVDGIVLIGNCSVAQTGTLILVALRRAVTDNVMNFPPAPQDNPGYWIWRISQPACWKRIAPDSNAPIVACTTECCVSIITVRKREGCDYWEFVSETIQTLIRVCPDDFSNYGNSQPEFDLCTNACGNLLPSLKR